MNSRSKFVVVSSSTVLVVLLLLGAVIGKSASQDEPYRHLGVFAEVLSRIKSDYVEEPDIKNVTLGAMNGMLENIDPFASYLNADQYKQYLKNKDAKRAGVGLVISKKYGYVGVVDVAPGSPAAKAGLDTNDMLETINGVSTRDMPLAYAEMLLSGDPGTNVELSVIRVTKPEPTKLTLSRAETKSPAITSRLLPDQVGYLQVVTLDSGKAKEVAAALQDLQKQGAKRYVLDLRDNAAGAPAEGIALANLFMDKGLITYTQGQKSPREDAEAVASKAVTKLPVAVIVNRGTAAGAEIAAAALGDNSRAELVGEKTYGDAAVRKAIAMEDGSAVILSIAKYYSPGGKAIQDTGVVPKHTVDLAASVPVADDDDGATAAVEPAQPQPKTTDDAYVKKAIEVLKGTASRAALRALPSIARAA